MLGSPEIRLHWQPKLAAFSREWLSHGRCQSLRPTRERRWRAIGLACLRKPKRAYGILLGRCTGDFLLARSAHGNSNSGHWGWRIIREHRGLFDSDGLKFLACSTVPPAPPGTSGLRVLVPSHANGGLDSIGARGGCCLEEGLLRWWWLKKAASHNTPARRGSERGPGLYVSVSRSPGLKGNDITTSERRAVSFTSPPNWALVRLESDFQKRRTSVLKSSENVQETGRDSC